MIGHAVLWKIIGANFFLAPARADLAAALRAVFFGLFALLPFEQSRPQDRQCPFLVLDLTASILATHNRARWNVQNLHRGVGCIDALSAGTASSRNFDAQLFPLPFKLAILLLGQ